MTEQQIDDLDATRERRVELRGRHSSRLVAPLEQREDLRGVHAMADWLDDAIRWSA